MRIKKLILICVLFLIPLLSLAKIADSDKKELAQITWQYLNQILTIQHQNLRLSDLDKNQELFINQKAYNDYLLLLFDKKIIKLIQENKANLSINITKPSFKIYSPKDKTYYISGQTELFFHNRQLKYKKRHSLFITIIKDKHRALIKDLSLHPILTCASSEAAVSHSNTISLWLLDTIKRLLTLSYRDMNHNDTEIIMSFKNPIDSAKFRDDLRDIVSHRIERHRYRVWPQISLNHQTYKLCQQSQHTWSASLSGLLIFQNPDSKETVTFVMSIHLLKDKNSQLKLGPVRLMSTTSQSSPHSSL